MTATVTSSQHLTYPGRNESTSGVAVQRGSFARKKMTVPTSCLRKCSTFIEDRQVFCYCSSRSWPYLPAPPATSSPSWMWHPWSRMSILHHRNGKYQDVPLFVLAFVPPPTPSLIIYLECQPRLHLISQHFRNTTIKVRQDLHCQLRLDTTLAD